MSRASVILLLAVLVQLAVVAVILLRPSPAVPVNPAGDGGPLPELPAMAPLESYDETTRRPLFLASRADLPGGAGAGASVDKSLILGRYSFVGAVSAPGRSIVLLAPADGGPTVRVREGEALDGWTVEEIGAEYLRLAKDGDEQLVPLAKP